MSVFAPCVFTCAELFRSCDPTLHLLQSSRAKRVFIASPGCDGLVGGASHAESAATPCKYDILAP